MGCMPLLPPMEHSLGEAVEECGLLAHYPYPLEYLARRQEYHTLMLTKDSYLLDGD